MFIQIRAVKREGFPGVWCAGRFWPSSESLRVEVLDEEPSMIPQDLFENGVKTGVRMIADMTKIGKKSLAEIKDDGRFSLLADGESDAEVTAVEFAALKAANVDLVAKLAAVTKERDDAQFRVAELEEAAKVAGSMNTGEAKDKDVATA